MIFHGISVGAFGTNCYLVLPDAEKTLLVIDPGSEAEQLIDLIRSMEFRSVRILLTHAHFDHIGAVAEIAQVFSVPFAEMDLRDKFIYESPLNGMEGMYPRPQHLLPAAAVRPCPGMTVQELPGHTPGRAGYLFEDEHAVKHLFSGDTIFAGSVGRTDLPGGSYEELVRSIRSNILTLPDETVIHPGHGPATTVGAERRDNPYLEEN